MIGVEAGAAPIFLHQTEAGGESTRKGRINSTVSVIYIFYVIIIIFLLSMDRKWIGVDVITFLVRQRFTALCADHRYHAEKINCTMYIASTCAYMCCLAKTHSDSRLFIRIQWPKWTLLLASCNHRLLLNIMVEPPVFHEEHSLFSSHRQWLRYENERLEILLLELKCI
jgi:hypothetical protein